MHGEYFLYNWCTNDDKGSGGGGGGGGSDDNGCGIIVLLFFICCLIGGTCNSSRVNEHNFRPPNQAIDAVEGDKIDLGNFGEKL